MEKRLPLPVGTVLQNRYRIKRQLGHGGFGAVYEAIDDEINLSFALKETFYAENEELRQAFRREARILARLSHDAFPRVTHYFTENDGCFLVMELIYGDDLDKLLRQRDAPFAQEQVLIWAEQILDALEDLHAQGIIHRDIKPSNLKLTPKGKIKLLDFGIAKGTLEGDTTVMTTVGSLAAATMQYAPLEQALRASQQYQLMLSVVSTEKVDEIMRLGTDSTSDLYALAATLYQLLTNTLPADSPTRALAIWSGKNDRLIPAHEVNPQVSPMVSGVLQKALELERDSRLATAAGMRRLLAEAVKPVPPTEYSPPETVRFVNNFEPEPTQASPESFETETVDSDAQTEVTHLRNVPEPDHQSKSSWGVYSVVIALPLLIVLVIAAATYFNQPSTNPGNSNTNLKSSNLDSRNENSKVNTEKQVDVAKFELAHTLTEHSKELQKAVFSPDGKTIASSSNDKTVKLWDPESGNLLQTLKGHEDDVDSLAFSPDGKIIASGARYDYFVKLWDATNGKLLHNLKGHKFLLYSFAFSPDSQQIATASGDKTVKLWDTANGNLLKTLAGHRDQVTKVAFSLDGKTIASNGISDDTTLWDAATGNFKKTLKGGTPKYSPDGKSIVTQRYNIIELWDAESGNSLFSINATSQYTLTAEFSPDGKFIAISNDDNTINLFDAATGKLLHKLIGYTDKVWQISFSPDSKIVAGSGGNASNIKLWNTADGDPRQTLEGGKSSVAFSPDGKSIVSGGGDNTIKIWKISEK